LIEGPRRRTLEGVVRRWRGLSGVRTRVEPAGAGRDELLLLSSDLLTAMLAVDGRRRVTLDDLERADVLARLVLARRDRRADRMRGRHPR
jgi:Mg-chelatase subunit ChlI